MLVAAAFLTLAPALPAEASAQGQVRGRLESGRTGAAVPDAVVELLGVAGERFGATLSDSVGMFILAVPGPGRYRVRAVHPDYPPASSSPFTLTEAAEAVDILVHLGMADYELAPLRVIGRSRLTLARGRDIFEANLALGKGRLITPEEIQAKKLHSSTAMLVGEEAVIPIAMPDGTMWYQGARGCVLVVVDGLWRSTMPAITITSGSGAAAAANAMVERATRTSGAERLVERASWKPTFDHLVMPGDLRGVEFYREEDEVPQRWIDDALSHNLQQIAHDLKHSCGLLVIWTKGGW